MDFIVAAALAIFAVTLFLMIRRPRGLRLGYAAAIGALAVLSLGVVSLSQAAQSFLDIWDAAAAFIGIVALSVTLDAMGFFRWAALRVVKLAGGSGLRLYLYVSLLTAGVSILFANDSAVLILTPIVLEVVLALGIDSNARTTYLFAAGLMADTAAMPLITSNPINIVSADFFKYTFIQHVVFMAPVAAATVASTLLLVWLFFRKKIPKRYDIVSAESMQLQKRTISSRMLKLVLGTLVAIDVGYVVTSLGHIPVSLVVCSGAGLLIVVYWATSKLCPASNGNNLELKDLARNINWDMVLFMLSIFLVVQGLENAGISQLLATAFVNTSKLPSVFGVFVPSMIVTVGASFMNNWPMTILGLLSIKQAVALGGLGASAFTGLIFSNVIGNNLGPHFFPLGSLAILMWLECMRKRGVNISLKEYLKIGAVLSIVQVLVASAILWAELSVGLALTL